MRRVSVALFVFLVFVFPLYLAAKIYLTEGSEKYLFVWAGDQARKNPDFLAVLNFDSQSKQYGKLITRVQLPGPGSKWNEPHHVGLSQDGNVLGCGGLLSVLKGQ
ncbi:selenium-binding family protein, partial [bacterium]|nr:selenium-binding family protein [bacterium]